MTELLVNARFLTRPLSGVDRVATEMVRALQNLAVDRAESQDLRLQFAFPSGADRYLDASEGSPSGIDTTQAAHGRLTGHLWEQLELPRLQPRAWLYSPCNTGPLLRRRQILTIHDAQVWLNPEAYSPVFRHWYRTLLPRLARHAQIVTTVSAYSKAQLERFGVVPSGKAHVIHNGADHLDAIQPDTQTLARHGLQPQGYFLAVGSLSPHKNIAMLARTAAACPPGTPPLVIAGGGNPRVFASAGISPGPQVRLLGRVTDAELKALYQNALAFAFPSLTEGFGLPAVEAMRCGCPVIASTGGAIPEVCGDAPWYADPLDPTAWTEAFTRLSRESEIRGRLASAGLTQSARYQWRRAAKDLVDRARSSSGRIDPDCQ